MNDLTWKNGKAGFGLIDRLARRWLLRNMKPQATIIYCPGCGLEMCASASWYSDTDLVRYKCIQCGHASGWLFDAPAPILIEGKRGTQ